MSESQLLPISSALLWRASGRKESHREGERLNLEVSSSPSNQQAPGAPLGAPLRTDECLLHEK